MYYYSYLKKAGRLAVRRVIRNVDTRYVYISTSRKHRHEALEQSSSTYGIGTVRYGSIISIDVSPAG
jgi:hypothetical protein